MDMPTKVELEKARENWRKALREAKTPAERAECQDTINALTRRINGCNRENRPVWS